MNENDFKFNAIMSSCKYLLPCGRCEMTRRKCTAANPMMTYTIPYYDNDEIYTYLMCGHLNGGEGGFCSNYKPAERKEQ